MVYTAGSLSLACLELFVHLDPVDCDERFVSISATLPARLSIRVLNLSDLPRGWDVYPPPVEPQDIGAEWVGKGESAVLSVPSAVIASECNFLINPAHPDFTSIEIQPPGSFRFDPRMWGERRR